MTSQLGNEIIERIREKITINKDSYVALQFSDPFQLLVSVILSQNTNDKNSTSATKKFVEITHGDPMAVISMEPEKLSKAIKSSGIYNQKAQTIIRAARWVVERYGGDLTKAKNEDPQVIRNELLKIRGIGPKTADVFLLFYLGARAFPIDVHIMRVSSRLKLGDGKYEERRKVLLNIFSDPLEAHLLLIGLGRKYCRPTSPKCSQCPLNDICPSAGKIK